MSNKKNDNDILDEYVQKDKESDKLKSPRIEMELPNIKKSPRIEMELPEDNKTNTVEEVTEEVPVDPETDETNPVKIIPAPVLVDNEDVKEETPVYTEPVKVSDRHPVKEDTVEVTSDDTTDKVTPENNGDKKAKKRNLGEKKKSPKIFILVVLLILIIGAISLIAFGEGETYTATMDYVTEEIPAQEEVIGIEGTYETGNYGQYIVDAPPSYLSSGEEETFQTELTGSYIAGEDFPAGVYDIVPTEGNGMIMTSSGFTIFLGVGEDSYGDKYDNILLSEGTQVDVMEVAVEFQPQIETTDYLPAGTYDIVAVDGSGYLQAATVNEDSESDDDIADETIEQFMSVDPIEGESVDVLEDVEIVQGEFIVTSGVKLQFIPTTGEETLLQGASDAVPSETIVETYTIGTKSDSIPICTQDGIQVNCKDLHNLEALREDIKSQQDE